MRLRPDSTHPSRRAVLLGAIAAGCVSQGPPEGWLVQIPGGGYVRTHEQFEPFSGICGGSVDDANAEVAFMADIVGQNADMDEAAAVANTSKHESIEAFSEAALARFSCGAFGRGSAPASPMPGTWSEETRPGRRLRWIAAHTWRTSLWNGEQVRLNGVRLLWESDETPLRISVWTLDRNGGRVAALRRAERIASTFTLNPPDA
jgi:hypothetical protein